MKILFVFSLICFCYGCDANIKNNGNGLKNFDSLKAELQKEWPKNRTINFVFHGHSVPTGYFKTPAVNTLNSYPYIFLEKLKQHYPNAVVNIITTGIGGENSSSGSARFDTEVLNHRPDVLFIDYVLNDRTLTQKESKENLSSMIQRAHDRGIHVVLLTSSPDTSENLVDTTTKLNIYNKIVKDVGAEMNVPVIDVYHNFRNEIFKGTPIDSLMSQNNHPNFKGHKIIADILFQSLFIP